MSGAAGKEIVIDANVAYSSGDSDRLFNPIDAGPVNHSRQCLNAVLESGHSVVFSRALMAEWGNHANAYAKRWLRTMEQKGRVNRHDGDEFAPLLDPACACLASKKQMAALTKDFHLAQSALATGQLILSNECWFPRYVRKACDAVPDLLLLHYSNPIIEQLSCEAWIKSGAEKEPTRRIDVWAQNFLHYE